MSRPDIEHLKNACDTALATIQPEWFWATFRGAIAYIEELEAALQDTGHQLQHKIIQNNKFFAEGTILPTRIIDAEINKAAPPSDEPPSE